MVYLLLYVTFMGMVYSRTDQYKATGKGISGALALGWFMVPFNILKGLAK